MKSPELVAMESQMTEKPPHGAAPFSILGLSGSARKTSLNTALLRVAKELVPPGVEMEIFDASDLPIFNQDLEMDPPDGVRRLKEAIRRSDAVLFAVPEHNYSVTALTKNTIEWGNRPETDNTWDGKPAAMFSASTSLRGGARAQLALRQIMLDVNLYPMNEPQLLVSRAQEKFDASMKLVDDRLRERVRELVLALVDWGQRLHPHATDR